MLSFGACVVLVGSIHITLMTSLNYYVLKAIFFDALLLEFGSIFLVGFLLHL